MTDKYPEELTPRFGRADVELFEPDILHDGFFTMQRLHYRHRRYAGGWSETVNREVLMRGEAVGVVLYDPVNDLIGLIEQIRPGAMEQEGGPWCIEVVAGLVEPGEALADVAWREIKEEANVVPHKVEYICEYMATPGGCNERLHIFYALADLRGIHGDINGLDEEGEDIRLLTLPASLVFDNLYGGRFNNAATLIALQWLQMNRPSLQAQKFEGSRPSGSTSG